MTHISKRQEPGYLRGIKYKVAATNILDNIQVTFEAHAIGQRIITTATAILKHERVVIGSGVGVSLLSEKDECSNKGRTVALRRVLRDPNLQNVYRTQLLPILWRRFQNYQKEGWPSMWIS